MPVEKKDNVPTLSGSLSRVFRFEQAWRGGNRPNLAEWVQKHHISAIGELAQLIRIDLRMRFGGADASSLENYFSLYPSVQEQPELACSIVQDDLELHRAAGRQIAIEEYERRFPAIAAELRGLTNSASEVTSTNPDRAGSSPEDTVSFLQNPPSTFAHLKQKLKSKASPDHPTIAGYEIQGFIAKGGMGVVYKARDRVLNRTVALKLPRPGYVESEQDKERFLREARSAARLRHPNICPLFEVRQTDDGRPYISMAFIEGETLKAWAAQHKPGPRQVAELMATLSNAVQYAHDEGVVHRDLKPSNVMVEARTGQPLLMDFGLAKDLSQEDGLTMSGDIMGTPAYMAPEQAAGKTHELGPAVDTYALGAMLYELLSGRPPFHGSVGEVLVQVQNEEPEPLRRQVPGLHVDLDTICQKAMAKQASDRYLTAAALADDLSRFGRGDAILARRQTLTQRAGRYLRKYPIGIGLGVTAIVAVLLLLSIMPALSRSSRLSQSTARFEAELNRSNWSPKSLLILDDLANKISALAPEQADDRRQSITSQLDKYVGSLLDSDRGKWSAEDWTSIEAAIKELKSRSLARGELRQAEADRLRGLPEQMADLSPPWKGYRKLLPALTPGDSGEALRLESMEFDKSNAPVLSLANQTSEGDYQIEAEFDLPTNESAGLALNAKPMHTGVITALAIHPDQKIFASASTDGELIRCWDADTSSELFTLPGHEGGIRSLDFSPDGKWLISAGYDQQAKIWETESLKLVMTLPFVYRDYVRGEAVLVGPPACFSRDGTRLFIGCANGDQGGEIRVWSVPDFKPLPTLAMNSAPVVCLAQPAAGNVLLAGTIAGQIYVWDTAASKLLRDFPVPTSNLTCLAIDAEGKRVAAGNAKGLIHVCDELGAADLSLQGFAAGVYSLAFHPTSQGQTLAAGYEQGQVKIWDLATHQPTFTSPLVGGRCHALTYAAKGDWVLAGNHDGFIQKLDPASGNAHYRLDGQRYEFVVKRLDDGFTVRLELRRNGTLLRALEQKVAAGPVKLAVQHTDELVGMQVNANPEMVFHDYFPPIAMEGGYWGVLLSKQAGLQSLNARRRLKGVTTSLLAQGDALFQKNRLTEALEFFNEQDAKASGGSAENVRQEAQYKAAVCLIRLNRLDLAGQKLQQLATTSTTTLTPAGLVARFQIWLLRLQQKRFDEAQQLFETIRVGISPDDIPEVIAADTQQQILRLYHAAIQKRKLLLEPGMLPRLETAFAVQNFFNVSEAESDYVRWQHLEALRLLGHDEEALLAAHKLEGILAARLRPPVSPAEFDEPRLQAWAQYAFVCRMINQPKRMEVLLDTQLWDSSNALRPEVQRTSLGLLLERARLHAHDQQWSQARDCLEQLLKHSTAAEAPRGLLFKVHLMRGFVLRRLNLPTEAQAAWREGCQQLSLEAADLARNPAGELGWDRYLDALLLGIQGDWFDESTLKVARERVLKSAGNVPGVSNVFPSAAMLKTACQGTQGQIVAEQIALGQSMSGEALTGFLQLLAAELVRQGAVAGTPTTEQDLLIGQFCKNGLRAYFLGELPTTSFLQAGLVWKVGPSLFGWERTITGFPSTIQADAAYILAHRSLIRKRPPDAKTLLELAVKFSTDTAPVRGLATQKLAELKGTP